MQLIAHRAPTSARAAAARVAAGATMFEIDVQVRAGEIVSSHYLPLRGRWTFLPIERDNWRLRRRRAVGRPGTGGTPTSRPESGATPTSRPASGGPAASGDSTLREVLDRIPAGCDILLDPKHHPSMSAEALLDGLVREVGASADPGRFVVSTGNPRLLQAYRDAGLRTWRSIGDRRTLAAALASGTLPELGVSIRHSLLDPETISALRAVTGIIVAWTVNDRKRASRLADSGVDAITTDSMAVLAALRCRTE